MLTIMGPRRGSGLTTSHHFAGMGGDALGGSWLNLQVAYAMNHNRYSLDTHAYNFPEARHECVDIQAIPDDQIKNYLVPTDIKWASAECKFQSTSSGEKLLYQGMAGLWDDTDAKPHVERSRETMKEIVRWASAMKEHGTPYRAIITENVNEVMLWKGIKEWYLDMDKLGYHCQTVSFNSMFTQAALPPHLAEQIYPIAQNRNRWYTVCTQKGNPLPDIAFRPRGWCPRCTREVETKQVWKECARRRAVEIEELEKTILWGDYNEQYLYYCPLCDKPMVPYFTPSYAMIDWSLPMTRIGDRKKPLADTTMNRIRKGLERFYPEGKKEGIMTPFLIEVGRTESENAYVRSCQEPCFTQTTAQTAGIVLPPGHPEPEYIFHILETPWDITEKMNKIRTQKTRGGRKFLPQEKEELIASIEVQYQDQVRRYLEELPIYLKAYKNPPPFPSRLEKGFIASYHNGSDCISTLFDPVRTCDSRDRHGIVLPPAQDCMPAIEDCFTRMAKSKEVKRACGVPESFVIKATSEREEVRQCGLAVTPGTATLFYYRVLLSLGEEVKTLQCA